MLKLRIPAKWCVPSLLALLLSVMVLQPAAAQTFTLAATNQYPIALEPGGVPSIATITADNATGNTTPVDVNLACVVTPAQTSGTPTCSVSPSTITTPASATLTVTAPIGTVAGTYNVTITGTNGSTSLSVNLPISILAVTASYTVNVTTPLGPSTIVAGSTATADLTITPINNFSGK